MGTRTSVALFVFMTIGIAISAPGSTASTAAATLPAAQTKSPGICAANLGSKCVYVAANGLDTNAGTFTAPYRTFLPAMKRAQPGDIIYARGGTYGAQNTTAFAVQIAASNSTCPGDQTPGPAPNTCYSILTAYIPILDFKGWTSKIPGYGVPN